LEASAPSLTIEPSLSFHDHLLSVNGKTISMPDVTDMKYGYAPIRLDMFTIGSRFMIDLKTPADSVTVNFRSYFGINKAKQQQKFSMLLEAIWDSALVRLLDEMTERIEKGEPVSVGRCHITEQGIRYKDFLIAWNDLSFQVNYNRLTLNSKSNATVWTNLYFVETYNVQVLMYFLERKFEHEE
jgi:hypothetical protein